MFHPCCEGATRNLRKPLCQTFSTKLADFFNEFFPVGTPEVSMSFNLFTCLLFKQSSWLPGNGKALFGRFSMLVHNIPSYQAIPWCPLFLPPTVVLVLVASVIFVPKPPLGTDPTKKILRGFSRVDFNKKSWANFFPPKNTIHSETHKSTTSVAGRFHLHIFAASSRVCGSQSLPRSCYSHLLVDVDISLGMIQAELTDPSGTEGFFYLHEVCWFLLVKLVGKYTVHPMDPMGSDETSLKRAAIWHKNIPPKKRPKRKRRLGCQGEGIIKGHIWW